MNVENLLAVKALILEEPKRFNMGDWLMTDMDAFEPEFRPDCGTVACIAGWGAILEKMKRRRLKKFKTAANHVTRVEDVAIEYFDISERQSDSLFFTRFWPYDLTIRIDQEEPGTPEYAAIAAEAIDRFIACNGDWRHDPGPITA